MLRWVHWKKIEYEERHPIFPLKWIHKFKKILMWDLRPHREIPTLKFIIKHSFLAMSLFIIFANSFLFINPAFFYAYIFFSFILTIKF